MTPTPAVASASGSGGIDLSKHSRPTNIKSVHIMDTTFHWMCFADGRLFLSDGRRVITCKESELQLRRDDRLSVFARNELQDEWPRALTFDQRTNELYVGCEKSIKVFDVGSERLLRDMPIDRKLGTGLGVSSIAVDHTNNLVYALPDSEPYMMLYKRDGSFVMSTHVTRDYLNSRLAVNSKGELLVAQSDYQQIKVRLASLRLHGCDRVCRC